MDHLPESYTNLTYISCLCHLVFLLLKTSTLGRSFPLLVHELSPTYDV